MDLAVWLDSKVAKGGANTTSKAQCWMRMPTGCDKGLEETHTPQAWFVDTGSQSSCERSTVFNTYCGRTDAESHWGPAPPLPVTLGGKPTPAPKPKPKPNPVPKFMPLSTLMRLQVCSRNERL